MSKQQYPLTGLEIAVIGLSVRMPGADTLEQFWQNLSEGKSSITHFSDEQLRAAGVGEFNFNHADYVKAKGIINETMGFEPSFFGYSEREAMLMDPQLRVYHECVVQALADSGYRQDNYQGHIGLYGGAGNNPLWNLQFFLNAGAGVADGYQVDNLNSTEYFNTRIAHKLNLSGPALTVQTACSSSLVAVHLAVQGLIAGDCDIAVAGGVHMCTSTELKQPEVYGYYYEEGMIASPDGVCRPFDAHAQGTLFSDGGGCAVLKRFEDAVDDGDAIYAILKGSAINNDGSNKVGFTAPGVDGQCAVIQAAHELAEAQSDSISYVEAHGTGTKLGDPLEVKALTRAFASQNNEFCRLGSIKANIGHLGSAAGIAGFIKAVLALKHAKVPGNINFNQANPVLSLEYTPFRVNRETEQWQDDSNPLRAGVSSFGIGGTNAHVILEEYVEQRPAQQSSSHTQPILLSAASKAALAQQACVLAEHLQANPDISIDDLAFTLESGRLAQNERMAVVADNIADVAIALQQPNVIKGQFSERNVVFAFTGQGAQYPKMALDFYHKNAKFKTHIDECLARLPSSRQDEIKALFSGDSDDMQGVYQSRNAQPLLFIVEYALAQYLQQMGIMPAAMTGHSLGEYVAATLAGVFSLPDALELVCLRGELMGTTAAGKMLAVATDAQTVRDMLPQGLSLAAVNTRSGCVVSGDAELVELFSQSCADKDIETALLKNQHAFHSELMRPIINEFNEFVSRLDLNPPQVPCISNVTGDWLSYDQAVDPNYWCQHLLATVEFSQGIATLAQTPTPLFIEIGPGETLTRFIRRDFGPDSDALAVNLLGRHDSKQSDEANVCSALAQLHCHGLAIDWQQWFEHEPRRVSLPGYQFARKAYIPEPIKPHVNQPAAVETPLLYQPFWQMTTKPQSTETVTGTVWLFEDNQGAVASMADTLEADSLIRSRYADAVDFDGIVGAINQDLTIVFGWSLDAQPKASSQWQEIYQTLGLLLKALAMFEHKVQFNLLGCDSFFVNGSETIEPASAPLWPMVLVAAQENLDLDAYCIDLNRNDLSQTAQCLDEINSQERPKVVAYRNNMRWCHDFAPVNKTNNAINSKRLSEGEHLLITGGLGELGLKIATHLANQQPLKLSLLSRRNASVIDADSQLLTALEALKQNGSQVKLLCADVSDFAAMSDAVQQAVDGFGPIHAAIHCAADMSNMSGALQSFNITQLNSQIEPKLQGAQVLNQVLEGQPLSFVLLMSSLASHLGGLGYAGYAAANACLDAFAWQQRLCGDDRYICVNWDDWASGSTNPGQMSATEALNVLDQVLSSQGQSHFVNSKAPLFERVNRAYSQPSQTSANQTVQDNPVTDREVTAPRNWLEQALVDAWKQTLGLGTIDVEDNFFDLGGDSLMAVTVFNQLKKKVDLQGLDFTIAEYFDHPVISQIAAKLLERMSMRKANEQLEQLAGQDADIDEGEF